MEDAINLAMDGPTKVLPHSRSTKSKGPAPVTSAQVCLLVRRMLVLAAAVFYVDTLIDGGKNSLQVLCGVLDDSIKYDVMHCDLINSYAGDYTIGTSKLIDALGGSTTPRNDTLFLIDKNRVCFNGCASTTSYNHDTYNNKFLRAQYADLVRDTSYNISLFTTTQLITPVVDCTSTIMHTGIDSYMRVFYLVRSKNDSTDVSLITYSFTMQDYRFPDQYQTGVTGVLTLAVISDMRFRKVDSFYYVLALAHPFRAASYAVFLPLGDTNDGYRIFESVPVTATEVTRVVYTSWRSGVYTSASESEQCNVKNFNAVVDNDPITTMSEWHRQGLSMLHNAWTWVHVVHLAFALGMVFMLLVLLIVIFRNLQKGKFWIGDAFVSVSHSAAFRGLIVLFGWYLDGFWCIMEFCLHDGKILSLTQSMFIYEQIIHADHMVIYLSLVGVLGFVLRERIDPALAVLLFEIGFKYRRSIVPWLPDAVHEVVEFIINDAAAGIQAVNTKLAGISPLRFRTTLKLSAKPVSIVFATCAPMLLTFAVLIAYVPIRKIYRRFYPDRMIVLSRASNMSTEKEEILAWKQSLTIFEVATGAALQNRVGLVTDYDNCVYIKGMKFASADGVLCNGYGVANGKWLVRTIDLPLLLGMVVLRVRLTDVYVYEVETYTVQKNARLFYPEMLSFQELFQLNTMILAEGLYVTQADSAVTDGTVTNRTPRLCTSRRSGYVRSESLNTVHIFRLAFPRTEAAEVLWISVWEGKEHPGHQHSYRYRHWWSRFPGVCGEGPQTSSGSVGIGAGVGAVRGHSVALTVTP